ncbi:MAG: hypothetical protein JWP60_3020 [Ramlibacter sp.]|nr:hypothetical protein [Ramlibacter sp.]
MKLPVIASAPTGVGNGIPHATARDRVYRA